MEATGNVALIAVGERMSGSSHIKAQDGTLEYNSSSGELGRLQGRGT